MVPFDDMVEELTKLLWQDLANLTFFHFMVVLVLTALCTTLGVRVIFTLYRSRYEAQADLLTLRTETIEAYARRSQDLTAEKVQSDDRLIELQAFVRAELGWRDNARSNASIRIERAFSHMLRVQLLQRRLDLARSRVVLCSHLPESAFSSAESPFRLHAQLDSIAESIDALSLRIEDLDAIARIMAGEDATFSLPLGEPPLREIQIRMDSVMSETQRVLNRYFVAAGYASLEAAPMGTVDPPPAMQER